MNITGVIRCHSEVILLLQGRVQLHHPVEHGDVCLKVECNSDIGGLRYTQSDFSIKSSICTKKLHVACDFFLARAYVKAQILGH